MYSTKHAVVYHRACQQKIPLLLGRDSRKIQVLHLNGTIKRILISLKAPNTDSSQGKSELSESGDMYFLLDSNDLSSCTLIIIHCLGDT